jgi:hypothetical protein
MFVIRKDGSSPLDCMPTRDVSDFRFFPLLELPKFKINKNKFLCSSDVPIFGLSPIFGLIFGSTQICNKKNFPYHFTSDFRFFLGSTGHIPDANTGLSEVCEWVSE